MLAGAENWNGGVGITDKTRKTAREVLNNTFETYNQDYPLQWAEEVTDKGTVGKYERFDVCRAQEQIFGNMGKEDLRELLRFAEQLKKGAEKELTNKKAEAEIDAK